MLKTKKHDWTIDEWGEFGLRCQRARDRAGRFLGSIPPTNGFGAKHLDSWMDVCKKMIHAMIGLERILAKRYGEEVGVNDLIHGPLGTSWDSTGNHQWNPRITSILTREQWVDFGREVKAIHIDVLGLMGTIQGCRGAIKSKIIRFRQVEDKVCRAKWLLEALVNRQHPDWGQASQVFSGPKDPILYFPSTSSARSLEEIPG